MGIFFFLHHFERFMIERFLKYPHLNNKNFMYSSQFLSSVPSVTVPITGENSFSLQEMRQNLQ